MRTMIKKRGSSASVRIPAAVITAAGLHLDQKLDVRAEAGRIVIEPALYRKYDLAALVAGITDENRHAPVDFGPPAGAER
jgi:antitoxin MazE